MSFTICSVPLLSALFQSCAPPLPLATGYVEGEYVLVAPVETTEIAQLLVARGDHLEPGAPLAELDRATAEIALASADANLSRAEAELADLQLGKRPEEIAVIEAMLASARAQAAEAGRTAARLESLAETGSATAALIGFLLFYVSCLAITWFVYARRGGPLPASSTRRGASFTYCRRSSIRAAISSSSREARG